MVQSQLRPQGALDGGHQSWQMNTQLGKEHEAKRQVGEEQAAEEAELDEQVSSFISYKGNSEEVQVGKGINQGSKGSPRLEQLALAQHSPDPSLVESSMPRQSKP